jgi:hypothetical protein
VERIHLQAGVTGLDPEDKSREDKKNVAVRDRPSWPQEGQLRHEEKR